MNNKLQLADNTDRSPKREIKAILFIFMATIFGGSLISFHPDDQIFWNITGLSAESHNLFGSIGSHIAGCVFFFLGLSSFWLVIFSLALAFLTFKGHRLPSPVKSILASFALITSSAAIISLIFSEPFSYRGGEIIAGGILGISLAGFTKANLNIFGAYILLTTVFLVSFLFLTNLSLDSLISRSLQLIINLLGFLKKIFDIRKIINHYNFKSNITKKKNTPEHKIKIKRYVSQKPAQTKLKALPLIDITDNFKLPSLDLLKDPPPRSDMDNQREELKKNARLLEATLNNFGIKGDVIEILPGPVVTMYDYKPAPGIKISKVAGLADDLAMILNAPSIRIVTNNPGNVAIGIEIPNGHREMVYLKEVLGSSAYKNSQFRLPITLGKDITGEPVIADLTKMPHLLVAGATGAGKSVSINTMINSLLFKVSPSMARFLLIDPKRIELSIYHDIPHLLHPVVISPKEATKALRWTVAEMERRYMILSDGGSRNLEAYNQKILKENKNHSSGDSLEIKKPLPYIILIIDELADLMMASSKEVEESITRLAQMARAAGIHLIIATQRPSVDVLTGLIKANFPTRISFQVSSKIDSRTILDTMGAENLLGDGDMLFMPPGVGRITRIHGAYVSEKEVRTVTDYLRNQMKPAYNDSIICEIKQEKKIEDSDQ